MKEAHKQLKDLYTGTPHKDTPIEKAYKETHHHK
jgi:hypothetical protein